MIKNKKNEEINGNEYIYNIKDLYIDLSSGNFNKFNQKNNKRFT
jgi:hypothetical protein